MNRYHYCLLALPLLAAAPALAQSTGAPAQSTAGLADAETGDIVVTADRIAERRDRVGQTLTVIDAAEIARQQRTTIIDLLRQTPGVAVARNGGVGGVGSVFIRGADSDQTVALIDGVKVNDPSSPAGGFDFGPLLTGNIARIEVLRGAASALWGSDAIGGVVNLITRQPTDNLELNARAEGGSFGTGQAFGNVSDKLGPVSLSAGGGWYQTDGISAFDKGAERDGFRDYAANGSLNVALARGLSVDLRGFYSDTRTDIDGYPPPSYLYFGDTSEYGTQKQAVGYGGINLSLFGEKFRSRAGYALTSTRRHSIDPSQPAAFAETFFADGRNDRIDYQGVVDVGPLFQATFGFEHEITRLLTSGYGEVSRNRARTNGVYGQVVTSPVAGLTLTGGVRHDDHSRFGGATTASASGVYTPNGGATTVRASYSEGFKAPTLYQLFSDYGNQSLHPERSTGWDAGVTQQLVGNTIEASATWFHRDSHNLIEFISCTTQTGICTNRPYGTYDNVARARAEGLEATVTLTPVTGAKLAASYTYLDARDTTPGPTSGARLARRPSQSLTVNADYRWRFGLETGATVTNIGPSVDLSAPTGRLTGYTLVDLRAALPISRGIEIYGRVENLFDERYETAYQYGQPGRTAYGGVRLAL